MLSTFFSSLEISADPKVILLRGMNRTPLSRMRLEATWNETDGGFDSSDTIAPAVSTTMGEGVAGAGSTSLIEPSSLLATSLAPALRTRNSPLSMGSWRKSEALRTRTDEGNDRPFSLSGSFSSTAFSSLTSSSAFAGFSFSSSFATSSFFSTSDATSASRVASLKSAFPSDALSSSGTTAFSALSTFFGSSTGAAPAADGFLLWVIVFPVATLLFDSLQPMIFYLWRWK